MRRNLQKVEQRRNRHLELVSKKQEFSNELDKELEQVHKGTEKTRVINELKQKYNRKSI